MSSSRPAKGFILLELIVVIVILGVLAAIAIPTFQSVIQKSRQKSVFATLHAVDTEMRAVAFQDQNQVDPVSGEANLTSTQQSALGTDVPASLNGKPIYVNSHGAFLAAGGVCYALQASLHFDSPATPSSDVVTTYGHIGLAASPADCS